ncbi:hypothetical protein SAMN05421788_107151 [Filimonas lacunae]|uniref:Uncharacterized protein n=1 Tax=Filimonas lacunae TaxID=477680 RepID=A0A173MG75_9BACT|nr:hypothetical protein [Filimonas lacunae]BAV06489.1 hypothetical protein FLA_2508 [Filimonas lacunae]SIT27139.1 hypothetical protein SAMN05421788_107151 [Filimonas lacunae]
MENKQSNPYYIFTQEILDSWVQEGVQYVKVAELETGTQEKYYELIPDPDFMGGDDPIYPIGAEDITELVEIVPHAKFVVHEIYLDMEDEEE